jgi:UDP-N-acetylmuramate dehydrogenase
MSVRWITQAQVPNPPNEARSSLMGCASFAPRHPDDTSSVKLILAMSHVLTGAAKPLAIQENVALKPLTTFKIGGPGRYFAEIQAVGHLREAAAFAKSQSLPLFVLGGGSNMLVSDRGIDAIVIHPAYQRMRVSEHLQDQSEVLVQVGAGKSWDAAVGWAAENGYWGIENLSHIPGQAGAALVQNIGAYGQQLDGVFDSVQAVNLETGEAKVLNASACKLGYRSSVFNTTEKGRWLIWSLTLRLKKHGRPNLTYPDLAGWFKDKPDPSIQEIRAAVTAIRDSKFPYPAAEKGGNAGSFFKNLVLSETQYRKLQLAVGRNFDSDTLQRLFQLRQRFAEGASIKIPSAFLISICGLKGHQIGGASVNETQPLVLLNQGGATSDDVLRLARHVRQTVYARTGMALQFEPELVGFRADELADLMVLDS